MSSESADKHWRYAALAAAAVGAGSALLYIHSKWRAARREQEELLKYKIQQPAAPPAGEYGAVKVNVDLCMGLGCCRNACPSVFGEIEMSRKRERADRCIRQEAALHARRVHSDETSSENCPPKAIHWTKLPAALMQETSEWEGFPELIDSGDGYQFYCLGAVTPPIGSESYLIVREGRGNIMVEPASQAKQVVDFVMQQGGVKYLIMTHRDSISGLRFWRKQTGCEGVLHSDEACYLSVYFESTYGLEHWVRGKGPVSSLPDGDPDVKLVHTPGHTKGHMCVLYKDRLLMTGDHLGYSHRSRSLTCLRAACWYDWSTQIESVRVLKQFSFLWVLPSHGQRYKAKSVSEMHSLLDKCVEHCEAFPPGGEPLPLSAKDMQAAWIKYRPYERPAADQTD
ncbi:unnamed protein product [Vitrella brassicaformis CCMP3155]|uniref:4Fe-4S ferredoxin-type domain-containing protein n=1 Tax=Vitrella brassicaformis (strain CCMP3155) TaxID=1169540 RepID=A0A0G4FVR4_VITBC|nr:unnamed protein product [Vitrella brassicaformis CCMP3155]|eukprot:CEM19257.1 unnamed protein product [Vitrella brassicaformis CCMP3155]